MKKLVVILSGLLMFPCLVFADSISLTSPESIVPLTWNRITEWKITEIDPATKTLVVKYRRRLDNEVVVDSSSDSQGFKRWHCRNLSQGDNAGCTAVDDPWGCCTGAQTGTCPEVISTCFSDVFGFTIRAQDVGAGIGISLRTLIWLQMKPDVLVVPGNDGSFE